MRSPAADGAVSQSPYCNTMESQLHEKTWDTEDLEQVLQDAGTAYLPST